MVVKWSVCVCVCVCVKQIVECIVNQDDLHKDMIGRKQAVKQRFTELQQQLDEQQTLGEQLRLDGLKRIQQ